MKLTEPPEVLLNAKQIGDASQIADAQVYDALPILRPDFVDGRGRPLFRKARLNELRSAIQREAATRRIRASWRIAPPVFA